MEKQKRDKILPPFLVEFDREDDGRWIAEVPKLPGVMAYGDTKQIALHRVYAIALRTLADKIIFPASRTKSDNCGDGAISPVRNTPRVLTTKILRRWSNQKHPDFFGMFLIVSLIQR